MPRISELRTPAEPTSPGQAERYRRILRAAARHGAAKGLERMQMHDVAKDAGVAIATLYRYFPSKTHLFTALMKSQVESLGASLPAPDPDLPIADALSQMLIQAGRQMLSRPLLAHAMVQANNASVAQFPDGDAVTSSFGDVMLLAAGIEEPSPHEMRLMRLIEQAWYGIIMSALNNHITTDELEADTALICRLLLADREGGDPVRS